MPVNEIHTRQTQADVASSPIAQKRQRKAFDDEATFYNTYKSLANNATEDVRVTLTSRAELREAAVEAARKVAERRVDERLDAEEKRAINAYENMKRMAAAEEGNPETATQSKINRIAGT